MRVFECECYSLCYVCANQKRKLMVRHPSHNYPLKRTYFTKLFITTHSRYNQIFAPWCLSRIILWPDATVALLSAGSRQTNLTKHIKYSGMLLGLHNFVKEHWSIRKVGAILLQATRTPFIIAWSPANIPYFSFHFSLHSAPRGYHKWQYWITGD